MTKNQFFKSIKSLKKAIELIGAVELASRLGLVRGNVYSWMSPNNIAAFKDRNKFRKIPIKHVKKIESITKYEVTKEDLRPDIWGQS